MVVIAEDDPDDRLLIQEAIAQASPQVDVRFVVDGAEMLDYLHHKGKFAQQMNPTPALVLLDLNMPKKGGLEALQEIKEDPALHTIPVVVLTTSRSPEHVARSYELGGSGFITKPESYHELVDIMRTLDMYWFHTVKLP